MVKRNVYARALSLPQYRKRVKPSKKIYSRKGKQS